MKNFTLFRKYIFLKIVQECTIAPKESPKGDSTGCGTFMQPCRGTQSPGLTCSELRAHTLLA